MTSSSIAAVGRAARLACPLGVMMFCAACVPSGSLPTLQAQAPTFNPAAFFTGDTEGKGRLSIPFKHRETTLVKGHGQIAGNGTIVLDQDVTRDAKPPTHRQWRLRATRFGHYVGTLTDASGPVTGEVTGNRLHLAFPMRGGLRAQQWLYLRPGGQVADNRMVVTKFGIAVATLDEVITRK